MPNVLLPILPGTLPPGYCFTSWQQTLLDFAGAMQAQLPGAFFFSYGDTVPDPAYNGYPWLRSQDMRLYRYDGDWISPNPEQSTFVRRLFIGTLVDLQTYDGGDTDPASDRAGPMWEEDTDFRGRLPIGPGDIPGTAGPTNVAVGAQYGSGEKLIAVENLPSAQEATLTAPTGTKFVFHPGPAVQEAGPDSNDSYSLQHQAPTFQESLSTTLGGNDEPLETVPPVVGIYFIKRTSRVYYRAS